MAERVSHVEKLKALGIQGARLLGCVAMIGAAAAPYSAEKTLENTEVKTSFVSFPLTLSFRPNASQLDLLHIASAYTPATVAGIGIKGAIDGLPRITTRQELANFISPERFAFYSSLADSPDQVTEAYEIELREQARNNFLSYELFYGGVGGLALFGSLMYRRARDERDELMGRPAVHPTKRAFVAATIAASLMSGGAAYASNIEWQKDNAVPITNIVPITALDGTSLEGTILDNPGVLDAINNSIEYAKLQQERRITQREDYIQVATKELKNQIEQISPPREGETFFLVISDVHASKAGIEIIRSFVADYREKFGEDSLKVVFNLGDLSQGLAEQRAAILELGKVIPGGVMVTTFGNHDLDPTKDIAREAGMKTNIGYQEYEGISIYNTEDPEQSPFLGTPSDIGDGETDLGTAVRGELEKKRATVANFHEPAALAAFLGLDTGELVAYLEGEHSLTSCGPDHLHNVSTSIASAGHWHDSYPLQIACNSDGTWSVLDLIGTAGGANEASTPNYWSDPGGRPVKTLSFRGFYLNEKYYSVTGALEVDVDTDGHVKPLSRVDIGTYDGAPFTVEQVSRSKSR